MGKSYKDRRIVQDVSLFVRPGEVVGLLGPNGAGKTTCFYMIAGLTYVDEGFVYINGCDVTHMPMFRRAWLGMGYLPQESSIFRGLNVEENILAVLEVNESRVSRRHEFLDILLDEFGLLHLRKSPSMVLSGGERRRLEFARALAAYPSYVLLDEPFAGVDPIAIDDLKNLVRLLKEQGIGILITDHNVQELLDLVDRAYVLYEGKLIVEGEPEVILNSELVRRVYLGNNFLTSSSERQESLEEPL